MVGSLSISRIGRSCLWRCGVCGFREEVYRRYYWRCPVCGSPLDLDYPITYELGSKGLDRFRGLLPFVPSKYLGEGESKSVLERADGVEILFKLEYMNPSGSFKDRGTTLAISYAYSMGFKSVVEDSSGNAGVSVALYSRAYGIKSKIIAPSSISRPKKRLIQLLGAELIETKTRKDAADYALRLSESYFYVAHTWSPFYVYGYTSISYEVYEEHWVPDVVITPVGSGGLLLGIMKGFEILKKLGKISRIPKPLAVQGYSVQPVFKVVKGFEIQGEESSLAEGIMVPDPPRLSEIKNIIASYEGDVVLVGNSEIVKALRELIDLGFIVEPTSATVYAALKKKIGVLRGLRVLLILTGSGLKTLDSLEML